jgi:hypothetical protein
LNGKLMSAASNSIGIGLPVFQRLEVNYGGNLYGITNDRLWYVWSNNSWQGNDGADLPSGPAPTPTPPALPTAYSPPYTPSAENTSISGGMGTLTTADGVFSFGAVNGSGWDLMLNGIPVSLTAGGFSTRLAVNLMTVYGHGQLFYRLTDSTWRVWTGNWWQNPSTGPVSGPVPVSLSITPSRPELPASSAVGTHVATVAVTMSDLSSFSGTISISDTTNFAISGSSIVTNVSPFASSFALLTVTQNGTGFQYMTIIVAT